MEETLSSDNPKSEAVGTSRDASQAKPSLFGLALSDVNRISDLAVRFFQGVLFWMLTVAGLGLVFLVLGLPLVRQQQTMETMASQMEARNFALRTDVDRLLRERDALLYDAFYVEKVARRDLSMSRKGEEQFKILPAGYESHRMTAEQHINTSHPVGLWRLYGLLHVLAEEGLIRQIAVILGGVAVIAAVLLFGRSTQKQTAQA